MEFFKKLFVVTIALLIFSCDSDIFSGDDKPYYKFSKSDKRNYLLDNYKEVGEVISFKNQKSEMVKFKVEISEFEKREGGGWGFNGGYFDPFFFETQTIYLVNANSEPFSQFKNLDMVFTKRFDGEVRAKFNLLRLFSFVTFDNDISLGQLTVNGVTYTKVLEFNHSGVVANISIPEARTVFYDLKKGIIGFDDFNDNKWRLVNE